MSEISPKSSLFYMEYFHSHGVYVCTARSFLSRKSEIFRLHAAAIKTQGYTERERERRERDGEKQNDFEGERTRHGLAV